MAHQKHIEGKIDLSTLKAEDFRPVWWSVRRWGGRRPDTKTDLLNALATECRS